MPPKTRISDESMRNADYWISIAITQDVLNLQKVKNTVQFLNSLFFLKKRINLAMSCINLNVSTSVTIEEIRVNML